MRLKVKNFPNLEKDPKSKAVVNVDQKSFEEYQTKKRLNEKVINMSEEINDLKTSVDQIKHMLTQILQRTN
jgi:hypothetical protein